MPMSSTRRRAQDRRGGRAGVQRLQCGQHGRRERRQCQAGGLRCRADESGCVAHRHVGGMGEEGLPQIAMLERVLLHATEDGATEWLHEQVAGLDPDRLVAERRETLDQRIAAVRVAHDHHVEPPQRLDLVRAQQTRLVDHHDVAGARVAV
jgi:hypothetical protein